MPVVPVADVVGCRIPTMRWHGQKFMLVYDALSQERKCRSYCCASQRSSPSCCTCPGVSVVAGHGRKGQPFLQGGWPQVARPKCVGIDTGAVPCFAVAVRPVVTVWRLATNLATLYWGFRYAAGCSGRRRPSYRWHPPAITSCAAYLPGLCCRQCITPASAPRWVGGRPGGSADVDATLRTSTFSIQKNRNCAISSWMACSKA